LWQRHFSDCVPILDFVPVAAKAMGSSTQGVVWAAMPWRGENAAVIAQLSAEGESRGLGEKPLEDGHTWGLFASDKLDYPRYRREGLPTTSRLIESQIKEFNSRVKGSEMFWYESNAEACTRGERRLFRTPNSALRKW
jgi:hypothetical protein